MNSFLKLATFAIAAAGNPYKYLKRISASRLKQASRWTSRADQLLPALRTAYCLSDEAGDSNQLQHLCCPGFGHGYHSDGHIHKEAGDE